MFDQSEFLTSLFIGLLLIALFALTHHVTFTEEDCKHVRQQYIDYPKAYEDSIKVHINYCWEEYKIKLTE